MILDEQTAIDIIREKIDSVNERAYEIFVTERNRERAGEYTATIIARIEPRDITAKTLSRGLLQLFVEGKEILWKRSYISIIPEKNLRAVDFVIEATISLE